MIRSALLTLMSLPAFSCLASNIVWLEAEGFEATGGWVVDQQCMDTMGSPYLLAHGLGEPVSDAVTHIRFPSPGNYHAWVRTRDWVAPWKAPGAPGRFQVLVDGKPLSETFGTEGALWHWQDGGTVSVGELATVALHDLTGFEGRCDAIIFSDDPNFSPPNDLKPLQSLRGKMLGWNDDPQDAGSFDLVVIGGGIAGTSAAVSAARLGLSVALVQDRPVLGGNGSSEVRVWPEGHTNKPPYPHIGDVVTELIRGKSKADGNAKEATIYDDARKLAVVRKEPNITLFLEYRVNRAEWSDDIISAAIAQHTRSGQRLKIIGQWFLDSTGDGILGALVGADFEITRMGHMGVSNLWNVDATTQNEFQLRCECKDEDAPPLNFTKSNEPVAFPRCPWAVDLSDKPFPGRSSARPGENPTKAGLRGLGAWFWETGFDKDPIEDIEWMRDQNLRAMYGAWDALKNVDGAYPHYRLKWAAFIAGKRESRRLLGDVVLTAEDFRQQREFEDACFPCSWHIDLHHPDTRYQEGHEGEEFISDYTRGKEYSYQGPYWAPYRCLYSRNIDNLFMAGRDISVTHEALGPVRVMRTCGMMGEIVGMAASICKKQTCTPREVYQKYLDELKLLMHTGVGKTRGGRYRK